MKMRKKNKITTQDVADALGVDAQYLRHIVESGNVDFGICVTSGKSKRRNFLYYPEKLREVIGNDIVDEWLRRETK